MPCYYPMTAYRSKDGPSVKTGKWPIVFDIKKGNPQEKLTIPCGQCIGCRLEKSRQWAIRCIHESSMYKKNCFITLTYNDIEIKKINNDINKKLFVNFLKYLRRDFGNGIRFFHAGENGMENGRAHHHACLFNFDFPDKYFWKFSTAKNPFSTAGKIPIYRSKWLEETGWPFGYSSIGDVTFETAAYVARYTLKKSINYKHRNETKPVFPEPESEIKEYITMSRGTNKWEKDKALGGIGKPWLDKFKGDVYNYDKIVTRNLICRPARYYDYLFDKLEPDKLRAFKEERRKNLKPLTREDLMAKQLIQKQRLEKLNRVLEH